MVQFGRREHGSIMSLLIIPYVCVYIYIYAGDLRLFALTLRAGI